jgi:hypothetical protein
MMINLPQSTHISEAETATVTASAIREALQRELALPRMHCPLNRNKQFVGLVFGVLATPGRGIRRGGSLETLDGKLSLRRLKFGCWLDASRGVVS